MPTYLDLERWNRRAHFELFRGYDHPFFNLCAPLEVTALRAVTGGDTGRSFFLSALWLSLAAANAVEPFRYRLRGDRVLVHEVIHGSGTILRPDGTFGFAYLDFDPDFGRFHQRAATEVERVRASREVEPAAGRDDLIHYSAIPWVAFTSFAHARHLAEGDSVPKIVFGKVYPDGAAEKMPVSVELHHALADGLDAGRFFEALAAAFSAPSLSGGPFHLPSPRA